jgi:heat shock protein HtpX
MNTIKTGLLLAAIGGLAVGLGAYFFGMEGAIIGLLIAFAFQGFAFFKGHTMALRFARAQPIGPGELGWYQDAARQLSERAGIPTPKLYLSPDPQPNAFAAGRNPQVAVVCVNQGLLQNMSQREVIAVLAHEIAHVRNRDTLIMTVAAAMASFVTMLAYVAYLVPRGEGSGRNPIVDLLMFFLAPVSATMIQLAISRTREFAADRMAAELMGDAEPMIDALRRLEQGAKAIPTRTAQPATAHMYIVQPLRGGMLASLFSTHPKIEDRVNSLRKWSPRAA